MADMERLALSRKARSEIDIGNFPERSQHTKQALHKNRDEVNQRSQKEALERVREEARQVEDKRGFIDPKVGVDRPVPRDGDDTGIEELNQALPNPSDDSLARKENSSLSGWLDSIPLEDKAASISDADNEQAQNSPQGD
eukprot:14594299-Heterocapsa_arctica.AAC.1